MRSTLAALSSRCLTALCICALWVPLVSAQTRAATADLTGQVTDPSKAVLPGATITITSADTDVVRTTTTSGDGRFAAPALQVGTYRIRVEFPGMTPRQIDDLTLTIGDQVDLAVAMTLAGPQEQVTVLAQSPLVDVERTDIAQLVGQRQIEDLPINGRNFISFSTLMPGVFNDRGVGSQVSSGLTFAGQRGRSNNITLDGLDNNDIGLGAVRATVSQDAVREFQVLTNSFSAEFGKASGGVVNIVTRSGANRLDGSVFAFVRDRALNARGHFEDFDAAGRAVQQPKAPFSQQQFGATLGGPIRTGRTFFFGSFERQQTADSRFVAIDDATVVLHPFAPIPLGTPAHILRQNGFPVDTGHVPSRLASDQALVKVDHHINATNWLTLRFNAGDALNENAQAFGGIVARSRGAASEHLDHELGGWWTSVRSDRWLNDLRFQISRRRGIESSLDPACGGPCVGLDQGTPAVDVQGVAQVGRNGTTPARAEVFLYQAVETVTYSRGRHQWRAGVDLAYRRSPGTTLALTFAGQYYFVDLPDEIAPLLGLPRGMSGIQALALGIPAAYVQGYGNPYAGAESDTAVSLFVQDEWRVRPTLTLNAGLRYQRQSVSDFVYTVPGVPRPYAFPSDNNNVAPRAGLAWDPTGDRKTAVRGAYGLYFDTGLTSTVGLGKIVNPDIGVRTLVAVGPLAFAAWGQPSHRLPEELAGSYPSLSFAVDPGLRTPFAHHASVGIDRALPNEMALSISFVSVQGRHHMGLVDYNPLVASLGPGRRPEDLNGVPGSSASILQFTSFADTSYNGLLVSLRKRFTSRSQFLFSYTLSKADDNGTDFVSQPDFSGRGRDPNNIAGLPVGFDPAHERGPSMQDQRHRLVLSGLYLLPRDVQASAVIVLGSGRPYNITAGADLNGDGTAGDPDRPRRNPADPTTTMPRNSGRLPGQATVDIRVSRRFRVGGRANVDTLFEVFNLFNRVNYTDVNGVFGRGQYPSSPLPTFGQFTQTGPPRQVQLAARLRF